MLGNKQRFLFALQAYLIAEQACLNAAKQGYSHFYIDGSLHSDFAVEWQDSRINNLNDTITQYNCKPIFHGNFKAPLASDVEFLRKSAVSYIKKEIDICGKLKCPLIIHGSAIVEPRKILAAKRAALNSLIQSIKELKAYALNLGVPIWLENLCNYPNYKPFHYIATTSEEFSIILDEVDTDIFFDFGHANVNALEPVETFFLRFHEKIKGISISNNNGVFDQHLKMSRGNIDFNHVRQLIDNLSWKGLVAFEIRDESPRDAKENFLTIGQTQIQKVAV